MFYLFPTVLGSPILLEISDNNFGVLSMTLLEPKDHYNKDGQIGSLERKAWTVLGGDFSLISGLLDLLFWVVGGDSTSVAVFKLEWDSPITATLSVHMGIYRLQTVTCPPLVLSHPSFSATCEMDRTDTDVLAFEDEKRKRLSQDPQGWLASR